jgi:hypothetical protein
MQMAMGQPPVVGEKKRSNWVMWLLLGAMVLVGLPIAACAGIAWVGYSTLRAPIDAAAVALNADPRITGKLGTPITAGAGVQLEDYQNDNGNGGATITVEVSGPNGTATVEGDMRLIANVWSPEALLVVCSDGTAFEVPEGSVTAAEADATEAGNTEDMDAAEVAEEASDEPTE